MRKLLEWGGIAAGVVLILFGIGAIVLAVQGKNTVQDELAKQQITGTPDMTPDAIKAEAKQAGLTDEQVNGYPTCSVAGEKVDTGSEARCFASYMNIHALEATGGQVYSQMPRYATADGKGTNDPNAASKGPSGRPLDNPARDIWVTETALSTALITSYMADQLGNFGLVVGIALLLAGVGFIILAASGTLRASEKPKGGAASPA
jgi:hypothetical protein